MMNQRVQRKQQIVQAAADVFAAFGYHSTKIQDVAVTAGIGKSTIYEYFSTKEELFLAVYDEWMESYMELIKRSVDQAPDALSKVEAVRNSAVQFYQTRAAQAPLLLEFWAHALRTNNPEFLERVLSVRTFLRNLGSSLTKQLVDSGWFVPVHAEAFAELETSMSDGIFVGWVLEGKQFPLEKAYTFRQSVIGMGLLSSTARAMLHDKLLQKLKKGISTKK
jgi:AcrR family transcriptional regulator